jgi:hypothetical protein
VVEQKGNGVAEDLPQSKRPVIAIPDGQAASGLEQFGEHEKLVGVGRSHRQADDHPRPAHSHMHPEAVEGLLEQGVLAEGGFSLEAATAVGTSKQARRQRHGVNQREGRVVGGQLEELLPEELLYLLEVGALTGEGGAVHLAKGLEPLGVMSEEEMDTLVGVEAKELAYDLYGEYLGIRKLRSGTALADATPFEPVVDKAEDGHDEGAKIHKKTSVMCSVLLG